MRRYRFRIRLLPLVLIVMVLILAGVQAQPLRTASLYLPLVSGSEPTWTPEPSTTSTPTSTSTAAATATPTSTSTAAATASATPTGSPTSAPATALASGSVRLRPVAAQPGPAAPNPQRYVIILDVSGSQNTNLAGQGWRYGQPIQCVSGPPDAPPAQNCATPQYAWPVLEERRIYVQKQAALRLISQLNMPGNAVYDAERPPDQVIVVSYNHGLHSLGPTSFDSAAVSDPAALTTAVLRAGEFQSDPYATQGGTHWAVGLYAAIQLFEAAVPSVAVGGTQYAYDERVLFVTDGVSNHFFKPTSPTISSGYSSVNTYPPDSFCRTLGNPVEYAPCQTTEVGGTYNGMDRPITQAVRISREQLQALPGRDVRVFTLGMGYFEPLGLADGVASTPSDAFFAQELVRDANGVTNVDQIIDAIVAKPSTPTCRPSSAAWVEQVAEANLPVEAGLPPGAVGAIRLTNQSSAAQYEAAIVRDPTSGALSFALPNVPQGAYTLQAALFYRGDDGVIRQYSQLLVNEAVVNELTVDLRSDVVDLGMLSLVFTEDVCAV